MPKSNLNKDIQNDLNDEYLEQNEEFERKKNLDKKKKTLQGIESNQKKQEKAENDKSKKNNIMASNSDSDSESPRKRSNRVNRENILKQRRLEREERKERKKQRSMKNHNDNDNDNDNDYNNDYNNDSHSHSNNIIVVDSDDKSKSNEMKQENENENENLENKLKNENENEFKKDVPENPDEIENDSIIMSRFNSKDNIIIAFENGLCVCSLVKILLTESEDALFRFKCLTNPTDSDSKASGKLIVRQHTSGDYYLTSEIQCFIYVNPKSQDFKLSNEDEYCFKISIKNLLKEGLEAPRNILYFRLGDMECKKLEEISCQIISSVCIGYINKEFPNRIQHHANVSTLEIDKIDIVPPMDMETDFNIIMSRNDFLKFLPSSDRFQPRLLIQFSKNESTKKIYRTWLKINGDGGCSKEDISYNEAEELDNTDKSPVLINMTTPQFRLTNIDPNFTNLFKHAFGLGYIRKVLQSIDCETVNVGLTKRIIEEEKIIRLSISYALKKSAGILTDLASSNAYVVVVMASIVDEDNQNDYGDIETNTLLSNNFDNDALNNNNEPKSKNDNKSGKKRKRLSKKRDSEDPHQEEENFESTLQDQDFPDQGSNSKKTKEKRFRTSSVASD